MYYSGGFAIHGAYWHENFGTPVSHGCVNLRVPEAKALYDWASVGTRVVVNP
jgi:lipoprotein-anchoring transpeptidase ErfK/SrfK